MTNYSKFYFSMLGGLSFIFGMFSSIEFGIFSLKFFGVIFFWIFGLILAMLYINEVVKEKKVEE